MITFYWLNPINFFVNFGNKIVNASLVDDDGWPIKRTSHHVRRKRTTIIADSVKGLCFKIPKHEPYLIWLSRLVEFNITSKILFCETTVSFTIWFVSFSKADEEDIRSLATTFDCRQKPLCDFNASCTADTVDKIHYTCLCNSGFQGNGSVCYGMKLSFLYSSPHLHIIH